MKLSDEELLRRVDAVHTHGSIRKAADVLGIDEANVRRSLREATRRNLTGEYLGKPLPEGYRMGKVTAHVAADGSVIEEWQRHMPEADALHDLTEELIELLQANITPLPLVDLTHAPTVERLLTLYPVVDVHLGQLSWAKETGENYDLKIARQQFMDSVSALMQMSPPSATAMIAITGDFYHADNEDATTYKSKNHLDVDGRHDKVLHMGVEMIIWMADMALQKHERVIIHVRRGNHDPHSSKLLRAALFFRYQGNPRITVDIAPEELWSYEFGKVMLSFTHGDKIKAEAMPGVMAAYEPEMWGRTTYRYGYSGHYHRAKGGPLTDEKHGARWTILPAFTAKDSFNKSMGNAALREILALTFDKDDGLKYTNHVAI